MASTSGGGLRSSATWSRTRTGDWSARLARAASSPSSVSTAGCTPRAISRSSEVAASSCRRACSASSHQVGVTRRRCTLDQRAELHAERHQPLLGTVMEVALDPPPGGVLGGDDPSRGRLQLGRLAGNLLEAGPVVDDQPGLRDQVVEKLVLARRQRLSRRRGQHQRPLHDAVARTPAAPARVGSRARRASVRPAGARVGPRGDCLHALRVTEPDHDLGGTDAAGDRGGEAFQQSLVVAGQLRGQTRQRLVRRRTTAVDEPIRQRLRAPSYGLEHHRHRGRRGEGQHPVRHREQSAQPRRPRRRSRRRSAAPSRRRPASC